MRHSKTYISVITITFAISLVHGKIGVSWDGMCQDEFMACEVGFTQTEHYCIQLNTPLKSLEDAREHCGSYRASLMEIFSWNDQREIEKFLEPRKSLLQSMKVWLDGTVAKREYRKNTYWFRWNTHFFPVIENFPYVLTDDQWGSAVVMNIDNKYQWEREDPKLQNTVMCVKKRERNWLKFKSLECQSRFKNSKSWITVL